MTRPQCSKASTLKAASRQDPSLYSHWDALPARTILLSTPSVRSNLGHVHRFSTYTKHASGRFIVSRCGRRIVWARFPAERRFRTLRLPYARSSPRLRRKVLSIAIFPPFEEPGAEHIRAGADDAPERIFRITKPPGAVEIFADFADQFRRPGKVRTRPDE